VLHAAHLALPQARSPEAEPRSPAALAGPLREHASSHEKRLCAGDGLRVLFRSRGGAATPVSSRNDAYGRQRNRRIEVWIREATRERER